MKLLINALLRRGVPQAKELPKPKGKLAINEIAAYYFYLKKEALKWVSEKKINDPWVARIKEWV